LDLTPCFYKLYLKSTVENLRIGNCTIKDSPSSEGLFFLLLTLHLILRCRV